MFDRWNIFSMGQYFSIDVDAVRTCLVQIQIQIWIKYKKLISECMVQKQNKNEYVDRIEK